MSTGNMLVDIHEKLKQWETQKAIEALMKEEKE
jgi:hypothetical protein